MGVEVVENGGKDKPEMSQVIRHYCKVCNRGFNCAGALGGHMRAHVIGDVSHNNVIPPHGDEHLRGNNKHSYFLRAKTTRFMGYHQASNDEDGEFKKPSSFGRFGVEKERVLPVLSSQGSKSEHFDHEYSASSEEEDLANCLVMLSNKSYALSSDNKEENKAKEVAEKGLFQCKACKKVFNSHQALGGHRASHKKVKGCFAAKSEGLNEDESNNNNNNNNVDEDSIQEDHESFTQTESDATRPMSSISSTRKRPKMHECSVCRRVFSSGQALGGHKRCHWLTTSTDNAFIPNFQDFQYDHQSQQLYKKPMLTKPHHHDHHDQDQHQEHDHDHQLDLNLNLPAPAGDSDHNTSRFEASTRLYLKQLAASANHSCQQKIDSTVAIEKGDKLRKLSDLRDVSMDGGCCRWGLHQPQTYTNQR
ncbi:Zinc finger protein ZAT2 [Sesamum angolense]|uniref:Zinc finger protein ZAT2 n=1 Tax=Sesamum angolense TaxID=2727404 RepID=A0AAE1WA61_9LAMI|nr:Zinc finger protein ZAT2 [Sesamum angolense]